ncbi:MAG: hypothetical protein HRT47_07720 [Candidatus Caenarcaniphilales bacterium]|nr:hypothetical protein [Candidatus Caenarcaniphilales bacterium]
MVASNYGGAYNSSFSSAYSPVGGAPTQPRPHNEPRRYYTSKVYEKRDTFVSDVSAYVNQSWNYNNGGRAASLGAGGGVPSNGYQYKVMTGDQISSHNSRLAAAYQEQAIKDQQRDLELQQIAYNEQIKAQQQYQTQNQAYAQPQQQYQDNTMQYVKLAMGVAQIIF